MENFKSLRYKTRNVDEKKKVEDMIMSKLGKWKYSSNQILQQIPNDLMQEIKPRWENAKKIEKEIFE